MDEQDPGPARSGTSTVVLLALVAVVAVPVVVAAVVLAVKGWTPTGEFAQADLRMRGFWSHVPDLGATGRLRSGADVSSHPGPASWWLMYPVYAVMGRTAAGLSTAVAAVALGWMAASLVLAWRRGGAALALVVAAALAVFVRSLGPAVFTEPWNPWFAIFPFVFFALTTWDVLCGHRWSLPLAVLAGTVCVQAHVGYAPLVAVVLVFPVAAVAWQVLRRPDQRRGALGALAVAAAVLAVMWLPPVLQQLRGDPGNMTVLVRAYRDQADPALGLRGAVELVGGRLDLFGPWVRDDGGRPVDRGIGVGTVVLLAAWAAAAVVAWRRRHDPAWRPVLVLHLVCAGLVVVAVAVASRILGEVFAYLVPWLSALTVVVVATVAWTAWRWTVERTPPDATARRALAGIGIGVLVVAASLGTARFATVEAPAAEISDAVAALTPAVAARLDDTGTYVVRWEDPLAFGGAGFGMIDELERRGFHVGADRDYRVEVRPERVIDPARADGAVWVVTGAGIDRWRAAPGAEEIADEDPRTPAQRRTSDRLHAQLRTDLAAVGGPELADLLDQNYWAVRTDPRVDDALRARIDRWAALGQPTAVFLVDPATAPPAAG
jgi:hypothetical protein